MANNGKVALVTGAGTGVGRATALAFLNDGYAVVLTGRQQEPLDETVSMAGAEAEDVLVHTCDVGDIAAVEGLFEATKDKFGRLDVLFNNAGAGTPPLTIDEMTPEQWQTVVDVNLTGSFLCARQAFAMMRAQTPQGGRIINNGSISAHVPRPGTAAYTATKHAITGLTRTISLDGRPFDIACGQIDIGNAATPMTERMAVGVPQANGEIATEPRMNADEVGAAVLHMSNLPLSTNVQFMTIMATKMPFIGRG